MAHPARAWALPEGRAALVAAARDQAGAIDRRRGVDTLPGCRVGDLDLDERSFGLAEPDEPRRSRIGWVELLDSFRLQALRDRCEASSVGHPRELLQLSVLPGLDPHNLQSEQRRNVQ